MIRSIFFQLFYPLKKFTFILLMGLLLSACELEEEDEKSGYTLFIQVANLNGSLSLSLNGKQTLTITGNKEPYLSKSFSQNLESNESINISFGSQPNSQMCLFSQLPPTEMTQQDMLISVECMNVYRGLEDALEVVVANNHSCAIANEQVHCWGKENINQDMLSVPAGLINPRGLSASENETCVIDDAGLHCWGEGKKLTMPVNLLNPREVVSTFSHTCATHDQGVTCWGESGYEILNTPIVTATAHSLTVEPRFSGMACVIEGKTPICWGEEHRVSQFNDLGIVEAEYLVLDQYDGCFLNGSLYQCWYFTDPIQTSFTLTGEFQGQATTANRNPHCIIEDRTLKCAYRSSYPSYYLGLLHHADQVSDIAISEEHACLIDKDGVLCTGSNDHGELNIPD